LYAIFKKNEDKEAHTDAFWIEEADRRFKQLEKRQVKGIPASQVFKDARLRLV